MTNNKKHAEVELMGRNFGRSTDWYNHNNLVAVEAANPTWSVGGKLRPAAYFVQTVEVVNDEMFGRETFRNFVAGPFATKEAAQVWADGYNNCPF